jgi:hypothetical protein
MLTTFWYLGSVIAQFGRIMDPVDVVTTFLNPKIDDDIYMTLPAGWPGGLNIPNIIVGLRKVLGSLKQAPQLWHDDINACLIFVAFTQSLVDPSLCLRSEGILLYQYVDDISMSYLGATTKAMIKVKLTLSEKDQITNLGQARQFFGIVIYHNTVGTRISLGQKVYITTILKRFGMQHSHGVSMPTDSNVKLDLAEDREETELNDITDCQAVLGLGFYAALATWQDISNAVAARSWYNS